MSATALDVNYWYDKKCAKAFWTQRETPPYRKLLADTAAWLDPAPGERWLDLGCGSGQLTRTLWEKSGGRLTAVVAIDCSAVHAQAIARVAHEACPPAPAGALSFHAVDFSDGLGLFPDASFDGAVSGLAIQYAQHFCPTEGRWTTHAYDRLLAEVWRVLKPGGRFVFSVNIPDPAWSRVALSGVHGIFGSRHPLRFLRNSMRMLRYGRWLKQMAAIGRFHYLPEASVREKLAQAGFVRTESRRSFARQAYLFRACRP